MPFAVRPTSPGEGSALRAIERLAGERFRDVGLHEVADHDPPSVEVLGRYAADGRSWVAVDDVDRLIGYVLVDAIDGNAHVEQVSVSPEHQGVGVGRALIERVGAWATERRMLALTLTTFSDVPWNLPLYRHLGFRVLAEDEIGPELQAVFDAEIAHGLDPSSRVCMRLDLGPHQLTSDRED